MALRSYRDLVVWQKALDLADMTYTIAAGFPKFEQFGLSAQLRDSIASIPSNIAEGYARRHRGDYLRHLSIASGSLAESETHLLLALRRKYMARSELVPVWTLAQEVGKMLRQLMDTLATMPSESLPTKTNSRSRNRHSSFHTLNPKP